MIPAYIAGVVRDRASDRGCTGGGEGAVNVGPPGEISGGFSFARLPVPGCSRRRRSALALKKPPRQFPPVSRKIGQSGISIRLQMKPEDGWRDQIGMPRRLRLRGQ